MLPTRPVLPLALSFVVAAGAACSAPAELSPALRARPLPERRAAQDEYVGFPPDIPPVRRPDARWAAPTLLQGFVGYSDYTHVVLDGSSGPVNGHDGALDTLPLIGGGAQCKLAGQAVDLGLEGLLSFSGRANATAFAVGGGGAVIAVDVDLLLFELYGGPFASVFLGDKVRVYAAGGPLAQFANYDSNDASIDDSGSGFGVGLYARTGLELRLPSGTWVGAGVRWSDSEIDLGSAGDLEIEGFQVLITVSRWN